MSDATHSRFLASFDEKLVEVTPQNSRAAIEAANELRAAGKIDGVNVKGFVGQSLDALTNLASMKRIHLQRCAKVGLEPLYAQSKLEILVISPDPLAVDLGQFKSLRHLSAVWHPKSTGLSALKRVERVSLWKLGADFGDVASLGLAPGLRELSLTQASLTSLSGIELLTGLEVLELAYLRGKLDLSAVAKTRKLKSLVLGNVPKHLNLDAVGKCGKLERLNFDRCGDVGSLGWMQKLKELRQFVFLGTKLVDRDFTVLAKLPRLKIFSADYRRDYMPPIKELEAMITAQVTV